MLETIPMLPGSYALLFTLAAPLRQSIGRLGIFDFPTGDYLYFGSAQGPGGLRARLAHHARVTTTPHWHLDWLRPAVDLRGGWYTLLPGCWECAWSQAVLRLPDAMIIAPRFGASDCRGGCAAHLVTFTAGLPPDIATVLAIDGPVTWFSPHAKTELL